EILAILGCCSECVADNFSNRSICIYSDSQATLKALVNRKLSSSLLSECRDMIQLLSTQCNVRLIWIPGRRGFQGNEKAGELARIASDSPFVGAEPCVPVSCSTPKMNC